MSKKDSIKIKDLIPDDKNFNKGTEFGNSLIEKSLRKFGAGRSILLDKNNRIIAGNKSVENAGIIGIEDVQIVESDGRRIIAVKRMDIDLDSAQGREMALADNATAKANIIFDVELVEATVSEVVCSEWGVAHSSSDNEPGSGESSMYTRKIEAPIYEAKNEKPPLADLYDYEKTAELVKAIKESNLDEDIRQFLIKAAQRHTVFNYEKIADYYANSSKEVQELMEQSALVIIDFKKAIEGGFVELTKNILEQYSEDYDEE